MRRGHLDRGVDAGGQVRGVHHREARRQDQPGCAFMGTIVHEGSAVGVVVQTGARTAFGQIAAGLSEHQGQTAFEVGLSRFSRFLFGVAAALTAFIFIVNVALSRPLIEALLFSLAIAVGIAPEMMPAIVTVSLSSGSKALAAKKVLVKRLVAIEDLGNIEILFTDKTGTLTEGQITFEQSLDSLGQQEQPPTVARTRLQRSGRDRPWPGRREHAGPGSLVCPRCRTGRGYRRRCLPLRSKGLLPFDHERQLASVLVEDPDGNLLVVAKGAPEVVLDRCKGVPDGARSALEALFSEGARVVAVATRPAQGVTSLTAADEQGLEFAGFLTFADRPKADAGESIAQLKRLGVDVKIITGDNGLVAAKVCSEIGVDCAGVLSGEEVEALDDDGLEAAHLDHDGLRTDRARSEVPNHQGGPSDRKGRGVSSATGSTTPWRCITPMSASRWTQEPTWPRTPPTSCSSTRI